MSTITAADLATRVTATAASHHEQLTPKRAARFLDHWIKQGIVEQPEPGNYRLTHRGRAMFAGWITNELEAVS